MEEEISLSDLKVIYIHYVGRNSDNLNVYHFLLSPTPEDVFAEGWGEVPACNTPKQLMKPDEGTYTHIKELKTELNLILAQDCCCFSFQDSRDHIVALAYEDISDYEEYPDPFRLVIHYGEEIENIDKDFAARDMVLKWIPKDYVKIEKES